MPYKDPQKQKEYFRQHRTTRAGISANLKCIRGISLEEYESLFEKQLGKCAVCGEPPLNRKRFDVDHDHLCCAGRKSCRKCVRALLHNKCNIMVGWMEKHPHIVNKAMKYLNDIKKITP